MLGRIIQEQQQQPLEKTRLCVDCLSSVLSLTLVAIIAALFVYNSKQYELQKTTRYLPITGSFLLNQGVCMYFLNDMCQIYGKCYDPTIISVCADIKRTNQFTSCTVSTECDKYKKEQHNCIIAIIVVSTLLGVCLIYYCIIMLSKKPEPINLNNITTQHQT